MIVLDTSEMGKKRFEALRQGVSALLDSFEDEDDEIALLTAGGNPQLLEDFTADISLLRDRLAKVRPRGGPVLYEAIRVAAQHIRSDAITDRAAIVAFAAGPDPARAEAARMLITESATPKIEVHVIDASEEDWRNQEKVQQLTAASGGTAYFPAGPAQLRDVAAVLGKRLSSGDKSISSATPSKKAKPLAGYRKLVVYSIRVAPNKGSEDPGGDELILQRVLLSRIQREKLFDQVVDGSNLQPVSADPQSPATENDTVALMPTLVEYKKGSRVQRQFIGWKGEARYRLQVSFLDMATRQPVLAFIKKGSSASGVFGGSQEQVHSKAMIRLVDSIVNEIKEAR